MSLEGPQFKSNKKIEKKKAGALAAGAFVAALAGTSPAQAPEMTASLKIQSEHTQINEQLKKQKLEKPNEAGVYTIPGNETLTFRIAPDASLAEPKPVKKPLEEERKHHYNQSVYTPEEQMEHAKKDIEKNPDKSGRSFKFGEF